MGKILLTAPEHVGIIEVVLEGLKEYTDHTIDFLDLVPEKFVYKNFRQRAYNFFRKNLKGDNIKTHYYNNFFAEKISQLSNSYDTIIIIRPDLVNNIILDMLRQRTSHFVAYYWDTIEFYPRKRELIKYFDKIYSFDRNDCKQYGFHFLSNFYYYEKAEQEIAYQVYNISTYDYRKDFIELIAKNLEQSGISFCLKGVRQEPFKSKYIQHIPAVINYRQTLEEIAASQVLLEVQKKNQGGLTFRPFEALGLNKKLITTNPDIRNYDFFDEANILVLDYDNKNVDIPRSFFETPYKPVAKEKREKYHLKNWVSTILSK